MNSACVWFITPHTCTRDEVIILNLLLSCMSTPVTRPWHPHRFHSEWPALLRNVKTGEKMMIFGFNALILIKAMIEHCSCVILSGLVSWILPANYCSLWAIQIEKAKGRKQEMAMGDKLRVIALHVHMLQLCSVGVCPHAVLLQSHTITYLYLSLSLSLCLPPFLSLPPSLSLPLSPSLSLPPSLSPCWIISVSDHWCTGTDELGHWSLPFTMQAVFKERKVVVSDTKPLAME